MMVVREKYDTCACGWMEIEIEIGCKKTPAEMKREGRANISSDAGSDLEVTKIMQKLARKGLGSNTIRRMRNHDTVILVLIVAINPVELIIILDEEFGRFRWVQRRPECPFVDRGRARAAQRQ